MRKSIEDQNLVIEKTIQRYVFEKLNYGDRHVKKEFYPEKMYENIKNKRIKVIIPEYPVEYTTIEDEEVVKRIHYADFRIIYNDDTFHNVEVEWITSRFNSHSKDVYEQCYKNDKGFIIVFYDDSHSKPKVNYIQKESIKVISSEEYSYWFTLNSKHLVDVTISNYVPNYDPRDRNIWVIYLPGSGVENGKKNYLTIGKKKGKWAFKTSFNKGKFMERILNIYKGDIVVFVWGLKVLNNTHQRQATIDDDWYCEGIEINKVSKGYYCDIYDDTFESETWEVKKTIEKKRYLHYFNFEKKSLFSSVGEETAFFFKNSSIGINERKIELNKTLKEILWSLNNQGCPSKITSDDYRALLMHIGSVSM